jgi:hypothetical protein
VLSDCLVGSERQDTRRGGRDLEPENRAIDAVNPYNDASLAGRRRERHLKVDLRRADVEKRSWPAAHGDGHTAEIKWQSSGRRAERAAGESLSENGGKGAWRNGWLETAPVNHRCNSRLGDGCGKANKRDNKEERSEGPLDGHRCLNVRFEVCSERSDYSNPRLKFKTQFFSSKIPEV